MSLDKMLVLAAHTDDGELGCGGSIARFIEEGKQVHYVAFSSAEHSLPDGMPKDTLLNEVRQATQVLGITPERLHTFQYKVRNFGAHRQEILEDMVKLRREIEPDLVFLPPTHDLHQDHRTVAEEAVRAFKQLPMLCYEQPWNNISFPTECFVLLEERHIERKLKALECYRSQMHRTYLDRDFIFGLAKVRGVQLQQKFAEAFEVVRWVL